MTEQTDVICLVSHHITVQQGDIRKVSEKWLKYAPVGCRNRSIMLLFTMAVDRCQANFFFKELYASVYFYNRGSIVFKQRVFDK